MVPDDDVDRELAEIHARYEKRKHRGTATWKRTFYRRMKYERDCVFSRWVRRRYQVVEGLRCLEVGAGQGENLPFFRNLNIPWTNIHANELLADRVMELQARFPQVTIMPGNALDIVATGQYDIVLVSAVFSSILDHDFRAALAEHLLGLLSPAGCLLWHDFVYQNPFNADVSGIGESELRQLFVSAAYVRVAPITLAAPVAVIVGPLYRYFSWIPGLRSHLAAEISMDSPSDVDLTSNSN